MTSGAASARTLDLTPLDGAVTLRAVRTYDLINHVPTRRRWWASALIVAVYLTVQMIVIALLVPIGIGDAGAQRTVIAGVALVTGAYAAFLGALVWRNVSRSVRLDRASRANDLQYSDREPLGRFAGTPLDRPGRPEASDVVRSPPDGRGGTEFAIATFAVSPGLVSSRGGFIEIRLDRPVPHIALENRRAKVLRRTGDRFRTAQRLRLEGDFDRTFRLYCPAGYERDALYLFTPDVMALLLDTAADCEVELIGDRMLLYSGRPWKLWRPDRFTRVMGLIDAIGPKAMRRTRLYRDDHGTSEADARGIGVASSGAIGVSTGGRRLRSVPSLGSVLSIAAPTALALWGLVDLALP